MKVQYYSDKTKKVYDSQEACEAAELEFDTLNAEKIKKAEERKARAAEVEEAYKHTIEVRKEAKAMIDKADAAYLELRNKFIKDYNSFHMTYSNIEDKEDSTDLFSYIFNNIFR